MKTILAQNYVWRYCSSLYLRIPYYNTKFGFDKVKDGVTVQELLRLKTVSGTRYKYSLP